VVEELCHCDRRLALLVSFVVVVACYSGAVGVDGGDADVDGARRARYCFQHGVGAEGVEIGAGVGEGECLSDGAEGQRL